MKERKKVYNYIEIAAILILCIAIIVLEIVKVQFLSDRLRNTLFSKIIQQTCGAIAGILLLKRLELKLFSKITANGWLYLIPCFIIAVDNFQFSAYFNGYLDLARKEAVDFILFGIYCLTVGLFEEFIFRGVIFSALADVFPKNKKGFLLTYVISSIVFGLAHIINGVSIQILYTMLTGGLFAFCLIKTKNLFCCAAVHAIYNFCGLLFGTEQNLGLGYGIVFDKGTVITMLIVSVLVGLFVVYKVLTYTEAERADLYEKLAIKR